MTDFVTYGTILPFADIWKCLKQLWQKQGSTVEWMKSWMKNCFRKPLIKRRILYCKLAKGSTEWKNSLGTFGQMSLSLLNASEKGPQYTEEFSAHSLSLLLSKRISKLFTYSGKEEAREEWKWAGSGKALHSSLRANDSCIMNKWTRWTNTANRCF